MSDSKTKSGDNLEKLTRFYTPDSAVHGVQFNPAHFAKVKEGVKAWK